MGLRRGLNLPVSHDTWETGNFFPAVTTSGIILDEAPIGSCWNSTEWITPGINLLQCVIFFRTQNIFGLPFSFFFLVLQMKEIRLYRCAFLRPSGMKPEMPQQESGASFNHHGSTTLLKVYEIIHPGLRRVSLSVWADLLINRDNSFSPGKLRYVLFEKIISC